MYFAHPIDVFCLSNFEKKMRVYQGFLFGVILVLIFIRAILKPSINNKMVSIYGICTTDMYLH